MLTQHSVVFPARRVRRDADGGQQRARCVHHGHEAMGLAMGLAMGRGHEADRASGHGADTRFGRQVVRDQVLVAVTAMLVVI